MTNNKLQKIAVIGTGIMGMPVASNLAKSGHKIFIYARRPKSIKKKLHRNMALCNNKEQLFKSSNILILNVSNTDDVEEILIGKDGLYKYEKHPKLVIDMSTICPIKTKQISQKLKKKNIYLFDCPVSGGEAGAINRKLSIMVGGEFKNYYKISNILNKIAKKLTYIGETGSGQLTKICNQIVVAQTIHAIGEAFILADAFKVNKNKVREALLGGFANSKILENHGQRMINKQYKAGFTTKLHLKDLKIAKDISKNKKLKLQALEKTLKIMKKNNKSNANKDSSSYYLTLKKET